MPEIWRNDKHDAIEKPVHPPQMNVFAEDAFIIVRILHVTTKDGKGFVPSVKINRRGGVYSSINGGSFSGTDDKAYGLAVQKAKEIIATELVK